MGLGYDIEYAMKGILKSDQVATEKKICQTLSVALCYT